MHASQTNSNILIDPMTLNTWHASFFLLSFLLLVPLQKSELQVGFYSASCPMAEFIIREEVNKAVFQDRGIAAGLVRLHFHDCFVRGCDASVLIDSTPSNIAEKDSPANNPSLRGFEVIDDAKSRLEAACPGVVSCADIIAFAARDSIQISGGLGYRVAGGRRDGRVSVIAETEALPPSTADLNQLTQMFSTHGLTQEEMVTLSGAHTIGRSHCTSFDSRLYSYSAIAKQDPSLDAFYATQLRQQCPPQGGDAVVPMNPTSPTFMDAAYYMDVLTGRGLFTSDHSLLTATSTTNQVTRYAINPLLWKSDFAAAMVKMGQIGADQEGGEIRSNCRAINNN